MRNKPDLKSCPDCDGSVKLVAERYLGCGYTSLCYYDIKCKKCGSLFLTDETLPEEAVRYWNEHRDEWKG